MFSEFFVVVTVSMNSKCLYSSDRQAEPIFENHNLFCVRQHCILGHAHIFPPISTNIVPTLAATSKLMIPFIGAHNFESMEINWDGFEIGSRQSQQL